MLMTARTQSIPYVQTLTNTLTPHNQCIHANSPTAAETLIPQPTHPHFQYPSVSWSLFYFLHKSSRHTSNRKAAVTLKRVQKRFTRMLPGLEAISFDRVSEGTPDRSVYNYERHCSTLYSQDGNVRHWRAQLWGEGGKVFFLHRVVGVWNILPWQMVEAGTIETFKKHLDPDMNKWGIKGYRFCDWHTKGEWNTRTLFQPFIFTRSGKSKDTNQGIAGSDTDFRANNKNSPAPQ